MSKVSGEELDRDVAGSQPAFVRDTRRRRPAVQTALMSVGAQFGLEACGLSVESDVMGVAVVHQSLLGYRSYRTGVIGPDDPPLMSDIEGPDFPLAAYVQAVDSGRCNAIDRMLEECVALGAHGVVSVELTERELSDGTWEYRALGTAVRALGVPTLERPFATTLSGLAVGQLLYSGWVPAALNAATGAAVSHKDVLSALAMGQLGYNGEIPFYTKVFEGSSSFGEAATGGKDTGDRR